MNVLVKSAKPAGDIFVSGNKNSALPVLAASLLVSDKVTLYNIPDITDVNLFLEFFESIGIKYKFFRRQEKLNLDLSSLGKHKKLVISDTKKLSKIRAVILLLVALLARYGEVVFKDSFSGCSLGTRPLTTHFENLKALGFEVAVSHKSIKVKKKKRSVAGVKTVWQRERSVTGTEVAILAAIANGVHTKIYNAACEPHVSDLISFLQKLGYKIKGAGTNLLEIFSSHSSSLRKSLRYAIFSDHHEIATFLGISAITNGAVNVYHNIPPTMLTPITRTFKDLGYEVETSRVKDEIVFDKTKIEPADGLEALDSFELNTGLFMSRVRKLKRFKPNLVNGYIQIKPDAWPGLPVDVLSLFVPLAAFSEYPVLFFNWMYDGGLYWTLELRKAGVSVLLLDPHRVVVKRGSYVRPATFEAPYIIRATIALFMTALSIPGESRILNADAMFRGHPYFLEKLESIGVNVKEV